MRDLTLRGTGMNRSDNLRVSVLVVCCAMLAPLVAQTGVEPPAAAGAEVPAADVAVSSAAPQPSRLVITAVPEEPVVRSLPVVLSSGQVLMQRSGETRWEPLPPGALVKPGDTISVLIGGRLTLDVPPHGRLSAAPGALFTVTEYRDGPVADTAIVRVTVWAGRVSATVGGLSPQDVFEVRTPAAVASVKGTEFSVFVGPNGDTLVHTTKGVVAVRDAAGTAAAVFVNAGQQSLVRNGTAPSAPVAIPQRTSRTDDTQPAPPSGETAPQPEEVEPQPVPVVTHAAQPAPQRPPAGSPVSGGSGPGFSMNGSFGTVVLVDNDGHRKTYTQISLQPEFSLWKIGVGLDLYVYLDENNTARVDDWDSLDALIRKIWYVRYGVKGDPFHAYVGGMPSYTLGHGLFMSRYSNMSQYPNVRRVGLALEINAGMAGGEVMTGDIGEPEVFGARAYVRPLFRTGIPLVRNLGIGLSAATDTDVEGEVSLQPGMGEAFRDDSLTITAVDVDLPVFSNPILSVLAFADVSQMLLGRRYLALGYKDHGIGAALGVRGTLASIMDYRVEYRHIENSYVPGYFGPFYDVERSTKPYRTLAPATAGQSFTAGPYAEASFNLMNLARFHASFEDYAADPAGLYPHLHATLQLDPALFLHRLYVAASYDKRNISSWDDFVNVRGQNSLITTEVGYSLSGNLFFTVINRQTFDAARNPVNSTTFEVKAKF